ncbi:hypothetical protein H8356DRAFT_1336507 [Neocallimastix lanati (nom. inval.)]|nr:hypothetical protein H8356DRAFT_1336507 [Neocallimastix sp. JGI-2020a]
MNYIDCQSCYSRTLLRTNIPTSFRHHNLVMIGRFRLISQALLMNCVPQSVEHFRRLNCAWSIGCCISEKSVLEKILSNNMHAYVEMYEYLNISTDLGRNMSMNQYRKTTLKYFTPNLSHILKKASKILGNLLLRRTFNFYASFMKLKYKICGLFSNDYNIYYENEIHCINTKTNIKDIKTINVICRILDSDSSINITNNILLPYNLRNLNEKIHLENSESIIVSISVISNVLSAILKSFYYFRYGSIPRIYAHKLLLIFSYYSIVHQKTVPYNTQSNGHALNTTNYIYNIIPYKGNNKKSHKKNYSNPNYGVFYYISNSFRTKFENDSLLEIILGYFDYPPIYENLDTSNNKIKFLGLSYSLVLLGITLISIIPKTKLQLLMVEDVSNELIVAKILGILQQFCIIGIIINRIGTYPFLFIVLVGN